MLSVRFRRNFVRSFSFLIVIFFAVSALLLPKRGFAADAIRFLPDKKVWIIEAGETTYAFGVNERGELQSLYWGATIGPDDLQTAKSLPGWSSFDPSTSVTPQEYPGWGGALYGEPALKATFPDGNREVILHYVDHKLANDSLEITLKDAGSALTVLLRYRVYPDNGIIERSARIENRTNAPVTLENAQSAAWTFAPGQHATLNYLTGRWAGEWQLQTEQLPVGKRLLESRRGSTSAEMNPWFAVQDSAGTDDHGRVWFGALGWSGSWRFTIERSQSSQVRVTGGFNPFDFSYPLAPGESLKAPPFYAAFTTRGMGEASRLMHTFELRHLLPGGGQPPLRRVLYNSWEATEFNVTEAGQMALAEKAARLGVERFVVDDGWFGQRNSDRAGLGDWYVNPQKFPHGLKPLIDRVHALGMDFGLWVEPEMVNPDSDLYGKHPDWVMYFRGRPRTEARNQLVLNLARDDVKDYVFGWLDRLVSDNDIALLKWDYNRNWSEPGWPEAPLPEQKKIWVKYVQNLYDILDRLRAKHPKLEIEGCSGGGARVDLGMMRRVDQFWTSDNTDALDRLTIQHGFTYPYAPHVMMAWVTDVPHWLNARSTPLKFRFLVAMTGSLGIGSNLNKMSEEDMSTSAKMVALYKEIRPTIQNGLLYRLQSPVGSEFSATEYVSRDAKEVVLFGFLHSQQFGRQMPTIFLQGLVPDATYRVRTTDGDLKGLDSVSGAYLMHHGIELNLRGDYDSTVVILERTR